MGFRPKILVAPYSNINCLQPTPMGFTGGYSQGGGNQSGTAGRLYLTKFWIPTPKVVNFMTFYSANSYANIYMGIYRGSIAAGFTLLGRSNSFATTKIGSFYPANQKVPPTAPIALPAGISWLALGSALSVMTGACLDPSAGFGMTTGICLYADGQMAGALPATLAPGVMLDTQPGIRHPGPIGLSQDLEFAL